MPVATIDLEHDSLIPVGQIAKERFGKRPSPATIWRWCRKGCRGAKLAAVMSSGTWHTTSEAFAQFIADQTAMALSSEHSNDAPADRSPETAARLKAAGLI